MTNSKDIEAGSQIAIVFDGDDAYVGRVMSLGIRPTPSAQNLIEFKTPNLQDLVRDTKCISDSGEIYLGQVGRVNYRDINEPNSDIISFWIPWQTFVEFERPLEVRRSTVYSPVREE